MTSPTLLSLAGRILNLTGPSRLIDCEIAVAVGWFAARKGQKSDPIDYVDIREPGCENWPGYGGDQLVPEFTASRDEAMTLRLDWMSVETCESAAPASSPDLQFKRCRVWDWRRGPPIIDPSNQWEVEGNRPLPLNICAAILRARAALEASHG